MKKCDSYHLQPKTRYTYHPLTGCPIAHDIEVGVCWCTKECDECSCGGDRTKCDFYPEVREKAKKEVENTKTNSEYIRAMTDDELAEFLVGSGSNVEDICHPGLCLDGETCVGCVLKWLKQPVKDKE